jgi:anti-repressor protein
MSNLSILNNEVLTMSSREIAELTGKRHDSVLRDIRNMLMEIHAPQKCGAYIDGRGNSQPMLLLDKEESLCLVAGYNIKLRMAIIKRWQELESQQAPQIPQTYAAALLEAGRLALAIEEKDKQLALAAPKVEFHDLVVSDNATFTRTQAAKKLKQKPDAFIKWLRNQGYTGLGDMPIQRYINQGLLVTHTGVSDGGHHYTQARITGKGLTYFAGKLAKLDNPL